MRKRTAILAMLAVAVSVGIIAFGMGVNSGWKTGVIDGQHLEVCNNAR